MQHFIQWRGNNFAEVLSYTNGAVELFENTNKLCLSVTRNGKSKRLLVSLGYFISKRTERGKLNFYVSKPIDAEEFVRSYSEADVSSSK